MTLVTFRASCSRQDAENLSEMVVQICYFHTQQYGKFNTKYVIYEREKKS